MGTETNKEMVLKISSGEVGYLDLLADDCVWTIPGLATFEGKQDIAANLVGPVYERMASMGSVAVTNVVAEGDYVVVEQTARDRVTKTGKPYNNTYCIVYRIVDGAIREVTEYCDTALARAAFS